MDSRDLSNLASIVYNLWKFYKSGCKSETVLYCRANAEEMPASKMFFRAGNYIFVRPDSLPLDPNIKAVCLNFGHPKRGARIYFETTLIDWDIVPEKMKDMRLAEKGVTLKGRQFLWNGVPVIATTSRQHFVPAASPRTVFYSIQNLLEMEAEPLVYVADMIWNCNCFESAAIPRLRAKPGESSAEIPTEIILEQRQLMRQDMLQLITVEQRPMLVAQMRQTAVFAHRGRILAMNNQKLDRHIDRALRGNPVLQKK